jgi:hypothetical protein
MEWIAICRTPACAFAAQASTQDDAHGYRLLHEGEHRGHTVAVLRATELPDGVSLQNPRRHCPR